MSKTSILVAGIGGASLGTELLKCFQLVQDSYTVYGCDISPLAFGLYEGTCAETFLADASNYVESVATICHRNNIQYIIPGGEQPLVLLSAASAYLAGRGIKLAVNSQEVIARCTNKVETFDYLKRLNIPIPFTLNITKSSELDALSFPCVIKPATGSGGSAFVFLASTREEAELYMTYLLTHHGAAVVAQEYIGLDEGEFTIGVLSFPDGQVYGSIALKRIFPSKLSISVRSAVGLISSGYSQGLIDDFGDLRAQAEEIARLVGSIGPLNIQGRVRDGKLLPFEINPRFSASTYLRAMAGFNEVDIFVRYLTTGTRAAPVLIKPGYYLRTLSETYVSQAGLKH
jgi:carbamoyl-phosphate synthase large subunit